MIDIGYPYRWFWLADDGRVYDAEQQQKTTDTDMRYKAWISDGHQATRWPANDAGKQTDTALQAVLIQYGLWVDLKVYTAEKRWQVETGGIETNGMPIATDRESQSMISSALQRTSITRKSIKFKTACGFVELPSEKMQAIALAVADHVQASFEAEADVVSKIEAGEIASIEQIEAYPWPGSA